MKMFGVIIVALALAYSVATYSIIEGKTISTIIAKTTWFPPPTPITPKKLLYKELPKNLAGGHVESLIQFWAKEFGAPPRLMAKIAECESGFDPKAKNPKSTAKGVFQFIDETWEKRCSGDVFDASDNIQCAAQLVALGEYSHWDESKGCWSK